MPLAIVSSVPKCIKCLSLSDIIVITDLVGLLLIAVALVCKADVAEGTHSKVLLFLTVAIKTSPKLSKDQLPGSNVTSAVLVASPQPTKDVALVTVAPSLCADLLEPD